MNDSRDGMYRRWWKKRHKLGKFYDQKGQLKFSFFLFFGCGMDIWVFDLCYSSTSFLPSLLVFSILRFFSPLVCVIKYFMSSMLLHWILVKFYMEGQINRLGPYDYSLEILFARRLWKCLFDWHCLLSYALTFGGW